MSYGTLINSVLEAAVALKKQGISAEVLKLAEIKPLDLQPVLDSVRKTGRLFVAEEAVDAGCVANELFAALSMAGISAVCGKRNLGNQYVTHGAVKKLYEACGLDGSGLLKGIMEVLEREA